MRTMISPRTNRLVVGIRVLFGGIWAVDAAMKWLPEFRTHFMDQITGAAAGQPQWLLPWFHFWQWLITPYSAVLAFGPAIIETYLALALILGFARKTTYVMGALWGLLIWSTAEGFGGPYKAGSTDIGVGIIYTVVFLTLFVLEARVASRIFSLDDAIERRLLWWRHVAEPNTTLDRAA